MKNKYIDLIEQTFEFPQDEFSVVDNNLNFHDVPLMDIIKQYGTPLKISYLPKISSQIQKAKKLFNVAMAKVDYKGSYNYCYCTKSSHFSFVLEERFAAIFTLMERFRLKTNLIHNSAINLGICVDNSWHVDEAIAALRSGKHVLCEKPVMMNGDELAEVMAAAKETGKIFYPRQNRRWDKDYRIVKKIYDEKLVGEVFNIECRVQGSRGIPGDWRAHAQYGGGMMLDWGVHLLDRLLAMVPEKVKYVFCDLTHVTNDEVDDGFKMHLTFESGLTAVMEVGTCHFASLPLWLVAGRDGTAVIDNWECEGRLVRLSSWEDKDAKPILAGAGLTKTMAPRGDGSTQTLPLPEVDFDNNELYMNLVDAIDGKAPQIVTNEQALRVLRLMEAAMESSQTHKVVEFEGDLYTLGV